MYIGPDDQECPDLAGGSRQGKVTLSVTFHKQLTHDKAGYGTKGPLRATNYLLSELSPVRSMMDHVRSGMDLQV